MSKIRAFGLGFLVGLVWVVGTAVLAEDMMASRPAFTEPPCTVLHPRHR